MLADGLTKHHAHLRSFVTYLILHNHADWGVFLRSSSFSPRGLCLQTISLVVVGADRGDTVVVFGERRGSRSCL